MNTAPSREKTLAERRLKHRRPSFFREKCDFLFRWDSLFYFALFTLLVAFLWIGYPLIENGFTQLLNWDYTWQYVPFAYTYWDSWHTFFTTGRFPMYDPSTFIGTDSIGSNSYYGLFDPFVVVMVLFPRAWIPQMFAVLTAVKIMVATLLTRLYLKYMGIQEWTARWASLAAGLSGYVSFFVGFPSFVSAACYIPLILLGLEKVIKERKPFTLVLALFIEGVTSFFFLVVVCIFGVLYALWRYFWTIKERNAKENWAVIGMGVASFAVALCLSCFTVLPSLRETMLSGRGSSIGRAYLSAVKESLLSHDLRAFFGFVFEPVGDHPARELMGLLSFFFPTGGHVALPLARSGYDAWTSALFCYTPCVVLFFTALIHSIRLQKMSHLLAVLAILFLAFTNSSYYLFYAFSGNGYGRWYIVLIPLIVYYCAWGFDQRSSSVRWVPLAGSLLALLGTIGTFYLSDKVLKGVTFNINPNGQTYWRGEYVAATEIYDGNIFNVWYLYYQLALVVIEGSLMVYGHKKEWLPKALVACVAIESIVMGNIAYAYDGVWSYRYSYANGQTARETMSYVAREIKKEDNSYFRTYADSFGSTKYGARVAGLNASSDFHSLMNFDVEDFALNNHMKSPGSVLTTYNGEEVYNNSWSGYYANKRLATDTVLGYRYYEISNSYSSWKNADGSVFFPTPNVPYGSIEIPTASPNRDLYRVYRVKEKARPELGYAVDSSRVYALIHDPDSYYSTNFYSRNVTSKTGFAQLLRVEEAELYGAMVEEDAVLPSNINVKRENRRLTEYYNQMYSLSSRLDYGLSATYYEVGGEDLMVPSPSSPYYDEGLGFFLKHYTKSEKISSTKTIKRDSGMVAFSPKAGGYFNEAEGCYIELKYYNNMSSSSSGTYNEVPRVYLIGDRFDSSGNIVEENALLSFEYNAFDNARKTDSGRPYYGPYSSTFGLYANEGKVKCVVFCYTGSKDYPTISFDPNNVYFTMEDYESLGNKMAKLQADKLQNVYTDTDRFTFETKYSEDRLVLTQLGYDKGWSVIATLPDGTKRNLPILKLNGGLVGFVAPGVMQEDGTPLRIRYEMRYVTPGAFYSGLAFGIGLVSLSTYFAVSYFLKKKKEEQELHPLSND